MSETAAIFQDVVVGLMIISLMLSVGLDLTLDRVRDVFRRPGVLGGAAVANHVLLPVVAFGLHHALDLGAAETAGLMLCAAAPGGPLGTMLALTARAHLALSVSLVVLMSLTNVITTPLTLQLFDIAPSGGGSPITFGSMFETMAFYVLIPLGLGMSVRHLRPVLANRLFPKVALFAKVIFGVVVVGLTAVHGHRVVAIGWTSLLAVEGAVIASIALGFLLTPGAYEDRVTVGLNSAVRNLPLSLLLATIWFDDADTLLVTMIYGLLMLTTGLAASMWWRRRLKG